MILLEMNHSAFVGIGASRLSIGATALGFIAMRQEEKPRQTSKSGFPRVAEQVFQIPMRGMTIRVV